MHHLVPSPAQREDRPFTLPHCSDPHTTRAAQAQERAANTLTVLKYKTSIKYSK